MVGDEQTVRMTSAKTPDAPIPATHVGILDTAVLAMVSTIGYKDGLISTNPVTFDWDGEHVRLSTLKSRVKYRNRSCLVGVNTLCKIQ